MTNKNKTWDVIVIGGGPAGMMAAGTAAENGKEVLLLEKNTSLGKKLLITGGGRCNVTNLKLEISNLVSSYKDNPKPLFSVFSQFDVEKTLEFFNQRGMETKVEAENRVFPTSNQAESVWKVLNEYLDTNKVQVQTNSAVNKIILDKESNIFEINLENEVMRAKSCVIATGGTSRPETGSTGDGFKWLKGLGHTIKKNNFALVPISLKDQWVKQLSGIALQDIKISIFLDGKKQESKKGKLLFTHFGISGPTVLNMSSKVGELLQYGEVIIELDLLPEFDYAKLKNEVQNLFQADINKKIKNTLGKLIPSGLVPILLELAQISPDKANNSITKEERQNLLKLIKGIPLHAKHLLGANKAIVSSGGVDINEVNFKTMESRLVPKLYIIGDVLNIDRPSGGYSLQICWSTGFVAGRSC